MILFFPNNVYVITFSIEDSYVGVGYVSIFDYLCNRTFFSRPSMKISHFSKTVGTIFIEFCTVILHSKVLRRSQCITFV